MEKYAEFIPLTAQESLLSLSMAAEENSTLLASSPSPTLTSSSSKASSRPGPRRSPLEAPRGSLRCAGPPVPTAAPTPPPPPPCTARPPSSHSPCRRGPAPAH